MNNLDQIGGGELWETTATFVLKNPSEKNRIKEAIENYDGYEFDDTPEHADYSKPSQVIFTDVLNSYLSDADLGDDAIFREGLEKELRNKGFEFDLIEKVKVIDSQVCGWDDDMCEEHVINNGKVTTFEVSPDDIFEVNESDKLYEKLVASSVRKNVIPAKTKPTKKLCNPKNPKMKDSKYICNPETGRWVKVDGKIGKNLVTKFGRDMMLGFSKQL